MSHGRYVESPTNYLNFPFLIKKISLAGIRVTSKEEEKKNKIKVKLE